MIDAMADLTIDDFDIAKHALFFKKFAKSLPEQYKTMDTNRFLTTIPATFCFFFACFQAEDGKG